MPKWLRIFFRYDRRLLGKVCRLAYETIRDGLRKTCGVAEGEPGFVGAIQTFGDLIGWHIQSDDGGHINTYHIKRMLLDGRFLSKTTRHSGHDRVVDYDCYLCSTFTLQSEKETVYGLSFDEPAASPMSTAFVNPDKVVDLR